jgi:hypothetical protein
MSDLTNEPSREPIIEPTNDRKKSEPILSYSHIKRDKSTPTFQLVVASVSNNNALSFNDKSLKRAAPATMPTSVPEGTWGAKKGGKQNLVSLLVTYY